MICFSLGFIVIMCRVCDAGDIIFVLPLGCITCIAVSFELYHVYHQAVTQEAADSFRGGKLMRAIKFAIAVCFHLTTVASYIVIIQFKFDWLWSLSAAYYSFVAICSLIVLIVTPQDPELKHKVDRSLWLDVMQKDSSTSDVKEEDYLKSRVDEDWHGT